MKSKFATLYNEVSKLVRCWYDGPAPFEKEADSIHFLPERVAFTLRSLRDAAYPKKVQIGTG